MALFGGKKEEKRAEAVPGSAPTGTPVEGVLQLRQQGLTNNQIVQTLQRNGYRSSQIFDAMNQADLSTGAPVMQQENMPPVQQKSPVFDEMPQMQPAPEQPEPRQKNYSEQVEELAEAIIEEKWQDLLKDVNKIVEWKNAMEERMAKIEQRFEDLQKGNDNLQKGVLAKVGEYDRNIKGVGTEIKAMEQVFKKVLPSFTANVNELNRITKNLKARKK